MCKNCIDKTKCPFYEDNAEECVYEVLAELQKEFLK